MAATVCKVQQMLKCVAEERLYISLSCKRRICRELLKMQNLDKGFVWVAAPCKHSLAALQPWKLLFIGVFFFPKNNYKSLKQPRDDVQYIFPFEVWFWGIIPAAH